MYEFGVFALNGLLGGRVATSGNSDCFETIWLDYVRSAPLCDLRSAPLCDWIAWGLPH